MAAAPAAPPSSASGSVRLYPPLRPAAARLPLDVAAVQQEVVENLQATGRLQVTESHDEHEEAEELEGATGGGGRRKEEAGGAGFIQEGDRLLLRGHPRRRRRRRSSSSSSTRVYLPYAR